MPLITYNSLQDFASAGLIPELTAVPSQKGWLLSARIGQTDRMLRLRDDVTPRRFQTLDALTRLARRVGVLRVVVQLPAGQLPDLDDVEHTS